MHGVGSRGQLSQGTNLGHEPSPCVNAHSKQDVKGAKFGNVPGHCNGSLCHCLDDHISSGYDIISSELKKYKMCVCIEKHTFLQICDGYKSNFSQSSFIECEKCRFLMVYKE